MLGNEGGATFFDCGGWLCSRRWSLLSTPPPRSSGVNNWTYAEGKNPVFVSWPSREQNPFQCPSGFCSSTVTISPLEKLIDDGSKALSKSGKKKQKQAAQNDTFLKYGDVSLSKASKSHSINQFIKQSVYQSNNLSNEQFSTHRSTDQLINKSVDQSVNQ